MNNPNQLLLSAAQNLKAAVASSDAPAAVDLPALLFVESELKLVLAQIQKIKSGAANRTIECVFELVASGQLDPAALISRLSALTPKSSRSADIRPPNDQKLTAPYKTPARYRDDKGHVWSGRGPKPAWLRVALAAGASLSQFSVDSDASGTASFDASADSNGGCSVQQPVEIFKGFNAGVLDDEKS